MDYPVPRLRILLSRGWRKKCPQCGDGDIYEGWLKVRDRCPFCDLQYLPNQGDLWGPLVFLDRVVFLIPIVVLFYFGVWKPGWLGFWIFGGLVIFLLWYTMPNRNGISLAIDYLIRRKYGDLSDSAKG
jgi:uncharacterized protein (DUF983 family)